MSSFLANPLAGGVAIVAAGLILFAFWAMHAWLLRAARRQLDDYKSQVVVLSENIDALKERHKLLPYMDKDFVVPMAGDTLAAYNAVAERLAEHRAQWLKLMDAWEQAQSLVNSEWLLGHRKSRDARKRIQAAAVGQAADAVERDCQSTLDLIEHSHANVAAKLKSFEQENAQFATQQDELRAASLSINCYQADLQNAGRLVQQCHAAMPADPLHALRALDEAAAKISQLRQKAARILELARGAKQAAEQAEQVVRLARDRRNQGLLLREPGADPDPLVTTAEQQIAAAWQAMNQADVTAATAALDEATTACHQAQKGIEDHLAARATCESELPLRWSESERLTALANAAHAQRTDLERDFAREAWTEVAENATQAHGVLAGASGLIEQAAKNAAAHVQNYFQARRLLEQVSVSQQQAEQALSALSQKLHELVALRGACQARLNEVLAQADNVARLLRSNTADRAPANERFHTAAAELQRLANETRVPRPDWSRLSARLNDIGRDLKRAEKLAREDIHLADQAAAEIAETENALAQARGFHEHGFRPDISAADAQLSQARIRLAAQEYEEAIRLANASEQAARQALDRAQASARQREAEFLSQQRAVSAPSISVLPAEASELPAEAPELPAEAEELQIRQSQTI